MRISDWSSDVCSSDLLVEFVDEYGALGGQAVDDEAIMDDLVPHIDRRAVLRQRPFDDLDGTIDAGTEAARGSQHKGNLRAGLGSHRPCGSAFRDQGVAGLSLVCAEGLFYTGRVRKLPGKLRSEEHTSELQSLMHN